MESRQRDQGSLERAAQIVVERGRVYVQRKRYIVVTVFSKSITELDGLCRAFGGNYYRHGVGYIWALGRKEDVHRLAELVQPHMREESSLRALYQPVRSPDA